MAAEEGISFFLTPRSEWKHILPLHLRRNSKNPPTTFSIADNQAAVCVTGEALNSKTVPSEISLSREMTAAARGARESFQACVTGAALVENSPPSPRLDGAGSLRAALRELEGSKHPTD